MKILVVEDEVPTAAFLRRGLFEEGYAVDVATTGRMADENVQVNDYDLILLDVMLPEMNGFFLCEKWRNEGISTPILFLTARDEVSDRVKGLNLGGDDYLRKPFAFAELLARVKALLRRASFSPGPAVLRVGDLQIHTLRRQVTRRGEEIVLTTREYQLLEHLARAGGGVVSRTSLWEHVWESQSEPDSNVIDVYVRYLRNKLGRDPDLIRTVRGGGYVLAEPDRDRASTVDAP